MSVYLHCLSCDAVHTVPGNPETTPSECPICLSRGAIELVKLVPIPTPSETSARWER